MRRKRENGRERRKGGGETGERNKKGEKGREEKKGGG